VLGTARHEARRIDNQLRGRAGRQGDPGTSRFFISLDDDLLVRFGIAGNPDVESVQRTAESQNLEIRQLLWKYESVIEHHRREVYALRREILLSDAWSIRSFLSEDQDLGILESLDARVVQAATRRLALAVIDDLWADYLANVAELRGGIHWVSWGGRDPLYEFLTGVKAIFEDFEQSLRGDIAEAVAKAEVRGGEIHFPDESRFERGATWTYLTTDQPFGTLGDRILKGLKRKFTGR
jgi:preprotein translocase subunit SecA